ncbi:MAG: RibD family protein [Pseudomonadota bacterium]
MDRHATTTPIIPTLTALKAAQTASRPLVVAQLGQSLDGRIATPSGHSHYVNGAAAIRVLHMLRAEVDAVIVGAGTVSADDPRLTVREASGRNPARVIIDRSRRAGGQLRCLADSSARRIVVGPRHADDPDGVEYVPPPQDGLVDPMALLAGLNELGFQRILVEGGSRTVSHFLAERTLDRLCILVGPMILGSGPVGLNLPAIETVKDAILPRADWIALESGDMVVDCDLRAEASP